MEKNKRTGIKEAFITSLPIMCSYVFVAMAYGIMMEEAGFSWYISLFASFAIYTGAFQFLLITFLSGGASLLTIGVAAFLMNSRQSFYSLTFLEEFKSMGKRKWYMIHTMTDETYAVNLTLSDIEDKTQRQNRMFWVALFSRCYWMAGAVIGGVLGQLIPFDMEGIDFCMTALFIIIFMDQWQRAESHRAALTGIAVGIGCLILFDSASFMLPALLITSAILMLSGRKAVES